MKQKAITYLLCDRLKNWQYGGAWVERIFTTYLDFSSADFMLRIEPDTLINKKFDRIPSVDVAGNLLKAHNKSYLHGGCALFKRLVVKKIVSSQLLKNHKYKFNPNYAYFRNSEWLIAEDIIWSDVLNILDVKMDDWDEIYCRVKDKCPQPKKYAVVHPVKEKEINYGD